MRRRREEDKKIALPGTVPEPERAMRCSLILAFD